jgi:hypothetical protein
MGGEFPHAVPVKHRRVPAKAGTHLLPVPDGTNRRWAPAFAGAHGFLIAVGT